MNKGIGFAAAGVAVALVGVGGTAFGAVSSIPDSQGVIHGCYDSGGNVKVIDTSVTSICPKGYTSLNWNQQGLQGAQGPQGQQGPTGATGPQGPAGPVGTDGVKIDAGDVNFQWDSATSSVLCDGQAIGPDASNLQFTAQGDIFNSSETWCQISGFPSLAVPVNVQSAYFNAFGGHQAPEPQIFTPRGPDEVGCLNVTPASWCVVIDVPNSEVQNDGVVQYNWEAMLTSSSSSASATSPATSVKPKGILGRHPQR